MSAKDYSIHPDLKRLCLNCAHEDCPDGGCKQYRLLEKKLEPDKRQKKQIDEAQLVGTPEVLKKLTIAITAMEELMKSHDCDNVFFGSTT